MTRTVRPRTNVDVSAIADEIFDGLRKSDPLRKALIEIEPGLSAHVDARLLRIVMENLLQNAWKFSSKKPETLIQVGVAKTDHGKTFFVRDNGAGFDMSYENKLFMAFQRLHSRAEFEGTGIGLATVHRIVRRHGGRIWAEGQKNNGATFWFTLPNN